MQSVQVHYYTRNEQIMHGSQTVASTQQLSWQAEAYTYIPGHSWSLRNTTHRSSTQWAQL